MTPLLFTNAALLAGLSAIAIPLVLHLWIRRRKQRMRFSTLQFFLKQDEKSGRRYKLRQWLLLGARILLVAMIVLAFARPYWKTDASANNAPERRNIVFVLDRSASMLTFDGGVSRWVKAKQIIGKGLGGLGWNDRVALVDCATPSSLLFPFMPPEQFKARLEQLSPGYGGGDLGEALQEATRILSAKDLSGKLGLYLVSDLQRSNCRNIATATVPKQIDLKVFSVGNADVPNRAVLDLNLSADGTRTVKAEIADFSTDDKDEQTKLNWLLDGTSMLTSNISLKPGATVPTSTSLPELKPGWHRLETRLESDDSLGADNVRFLTFSLPVPVSVLCVETRTNEHVFEEESFFVLNALEPGLSLSNALPTLFKTDKIGLTEAAAIIGNPERLRQYQLVLLPALREIPDGMGKALLEFVKQGGNLAFWLGDNLSKNQYNSEFGELLPAEINQNQGGVLSVENNLHLGEVDFDSGVFSIFHQPESGDVSLPEFSRCDALAPVASAHVLARFNDNTPFLVTRDIGDGRVALINSTMDTGWTDWPKRKTFVPWIHSLCHYLTRTEDNAGIQQGKTCAANALAILETDPMNAGKTFEVVSPDGVKSPVVLGPQGNLSWRPTVPGFYLIIDASGKLVQQMAVNVPESESDLTALSLTGFEQQIVRNDLPPNPGLTAALFGAGSGDSGFWRLLILGAAVLLLLETLLANRTFA